jgi:hypothetical protein
LNAEEHSNVAVVSDAAVDGHDDDDDDVTAETRGGDKGGNREAGAHDTGTEAMEDNAVERGVRPCI